MSILTPHADVLGMTIGCVCLYSCFLNCIKLEICTGWYLHFVQAEDGVDAAELTRADQQLV